jgi:hypothetical protein
MILQNPKVPQILHNVSLKAPNVELRSSKDFNPQGTTPPT